MNYKGLLKLQKQVDNARLTTDETIATATWTFIPWDAEQTNHENAQTFIKSGSTTILQLKELGIYYIHVVLTWSSNSTGDRVIVIKQGSDIIGGSRVQASGYTTHDASTTFETTSIPTEIKIQCYQDSGADRALEWDRSTQCTVTKLGKNYL